MAMVVLLRGVNIGTKNRLKMAELREALTDASFEDVATYIQSGNIVLTDGKGRDEAAVAATVEELLETRFGISTRAHVLGATALVAAVAANPFPVPAEADPKTVHYFFHSEPVDLDTARSRVVDGEEIVAGDGVVHLYAPHGLAKCKAAEAILARGGDGITARNHRTVLALSEMLG